MLNNVFSCQHHKIKAKKMPNCDVHAKHHFFMPTTKKAEFLLKMPTWQTCFAICFTRENTASAAMVNFGNSDKTKGGYRSAVPESTPEGFCIFLSDPDPESKIFFKSELIRSHFSISSVAGVCVVIS